MVHEFKGNEYLINLIDTPGHVDFGGDVTRAMRAVDGCIVLCDAVEGVMPQTETVLRQALRERVKPILFINKVDRLIKELKLTPEAMQERLMKLIIHVNQLIRKIAESDFGERWQVNVNDGSVCFGSAFHNWGLSIPYMKENNVTFKEIIASYENDQVKELKKRCPIHKVVLDSVIKHHPNPKQAQLYRIPKLWHGELEGKDGKSLMNCDPTGPMFFVITKISVDPQAGEIATGRLFSGTITKGMNVYLNRSKQNTRIQQVFVMNGAKREIIERVPQEISSLSAALNPILERLSARSLLSPSRRSATSLSRSSRKLSRRNHQLTFLDWLRSCVSSVKRIRLSGLRSTKRLASI
jgi:elongation factor 2